MMRDNVRLGNHYKNLKLITMLLYRKLIIILFADLGRLNLTTVAEKRRVTGTSLENTMRQALLGTY